MPTSFHVNAHDLEFILKQIEVSELQASTPGMTTVQAIQAVYGVSAADAALMPVGLRTVDGSDNSLLPGMESNGAGDTPFPRLLDPIYSNEGDENPFFGVGNTNYGNSGSVVDSDPRIISNLIVDQTPANTAAIYAALKAIGTTGTDANAAVTAISSAYQGTLNANGASAAVTRATATLSAETEQHGAAVTALNAANTRVGHFDAAGPLAPEAVTAAEAADAALSQLIADLSGPSGPETVAASFTAALAAAQAAVNAATAVTAALAEDALPAAQATLDAARALLDALDAADEDTLIDATDLEALQDAALAYDDAVGSSGHAADSVAAVEAARLAAQAQADAAEAVADAAQVELNTAQDAYDAAVASAGTAGTPAQAAALLADALEDYGLTTGAEGGLVIDHVSPDVGLTAPFNSFMTIFGQFFDHGLDLVNKGGNGTVFIPLQPDDPLIAGADKVFGTGDDLPLNVRFMVLTRATPVVDENGVEQHVNATTSFVDQNQTYTSHASHQVFLREQVRLEIDGVTRAYSTGHLLDGRTGTGSLNGAVGNWADVKAQALEVLGIRLSDMDVHRVPLLATDAYGNLITGPNGYAQMVMAPDATHSEPWLREGTAAGITTQGSIAAGPAFLVDIAHHAAPSAGMTPDGDNVTGDDRNSATYDDEMLDLHIVSGDGRGNENIALQSLHAIFHSEHNRILEENKHTILETNDVSFINQWLLVPLAAGTNLSTIDPSDLIWNGDRMFQAARFTTEMQYQHMVFEEFARRIAPGVDPFVFTNSADIDASIVAEFAHAVYRFGHSMLTDTVDRLGADLRPVNGDAGQMSLVEAFLNPEAFTGTGDTLHEVQAAFIRGLTSDVGSEIDEFIVPALRSNLLGLPLDLAALNIARARETGVPSLNETRAQLYNDFGLPDLKPYASWAEFTQYLKNPFSIANFIAAYGNHESITTATTLAAKREAASLLLFGDGTNGNGVTIRGETYTNEDRLNFLNGRGGYGAGNDRGGLDNVDLWIGGLAERVTEFGGMLGTTFGFIFEYQMEQLQNGDRFYYLSRTQGLNLLDALEANTFADIVMRNSDLSDVYATHINATLFLTPDMILELDRAIAQRDYNGSAAGRDPVWEDPLLQQLDPKVIRVDSGVTDANGHQVGGELHFRGGEHVVLGGTEGNDRLTSDLGDDALWGDGGDDYLNGGAGADQVFGGDGDDIIEDTFGDNFLRGERGNDVVSSSRGINLLFGGEGQDALLIGQDAGEGFGGEGNDFILGGSGGDNLLGNEGNDWIEGGEGFDVISGDNSELFFNSTVIGHDVAWGQGNDQDYDLESGDDIALSGIGVQRFEGMFGFDWASAKYDVAGVNWDFNIPIFTSAPADILRDRFDLMEAMSGWVNDDVMLGDNRDGTVGGVDADANFDDHVLDAAGINRIAGLRSWFDGALETLGGPGATTFRDGNIIMGGGGSDRMMGRAGFDVIDGDAWLNVRIRIMVDGVEYSAESLNSSQAAAGPFAGRVYALGADGRPDFSQAAFGGRALTSLLLDRTINPGDMSIVREILTVASGTSRDRALFAGNLSEYEIEGRGVQLSGDRLIQAAYDVNGDGFISVRDLGGNGRVAFDDTDLIRNVEDLQFADQTIAIDTPLGINVNLALEVDGAPAALPAIGSTIGRVTAQGVPGTFALAAGSSNRFSLAEDGTLVRVGALGINQSHQLDLTFTTSGGLSRTERLQVLTGSNAADVITGSANDDLVYGMGDIDVLTGGAGDDVLFGQAGNDQLIGGDGHDILVGGRNNDQVQGGAGDDLILFAWGDGNDIVDGGDGTDRLRIDGTSLNQTLVGAWNGTALTTLTGFTAFASVEQIHVDLGGGTDTLAYSAGSASVVVNLSAGTASGFASVANVTNVTSSAGADMLVGNNQANVLNAAGGNDFLVAALDNASDLFIGGGGIDTLDLSAYAADLSVDLSFATATISGTGTTDALSDRVQTVEALILGSGADTAYGSNSGNSLQGGGGADTLAGMNGNDTLEGGEGNDRLIGGVGLDMLTGGLGEDVFVFATSTHSSLAASDVITDFAGAGAPGGDIIDISEISGLAFLFVGSAAFAPGGTTQVRVFQDDNDTFVQIDTDTDTAAEAQIRILGLHNLGASDFFL